MATRHLVTNWRSDSVRLAFSRALGLASEHGCGLTLWPPSRSQLQSGYLRDGLGDSLSDVLLAAGQSQDERVPITLVTSRSELGIGRVEDVILAVFPDEDALDDVDDIASHSPAIVVVPFPVTQGLDSSARLWLRTWNAEVLDGEQPREERLFEDPVSERAVHRLADPAYDMARSGDREAAEELIDLVRHGGHPIDPDSVKALLLREGRCPAEANALRDIARDVPDAGRQQRARGSRWASDILNQLRVHASDLGPGGDAV